MRKWTAFALTAAAAFTSPLLYSQTANIKCQTDIARHYLITNNKISSQAMRRANELLTYQLKKNQLEVDDNVYTVPIVVHVIHTGSPIGIEENPSDQSIINMINGVNNAFRKNGTAYGGEDIKIQFKLATRSQNCSGTNGINRVNGSSLVNYTSGGITNHNYAGSVPEETVKALSRWSNTDYINVWIVNRIDGALFSGGYAYFGEYNNATVDGIVLQYHSVQPGGETLTHELGHYFELYHTFEGDGFGAFCPRADSCAFYGDLICDTEPAMVEYDCSNTINSCTGNPYVIADAGHGYTVLNNYMNYTNCPKMFTLQQKERMRAALFAFRSGLLSSGGLNGVPSLAPAAACIPTASFGSSIYYGIERVQFNTLNVYSNSSAADGAQYIDRSCNQRTTVFKGQIVNLTVTGSYLNYAWLRVYLDYNNDGDFDDAGETLLSTANGEESVAVTIPSTGIITGIPLRLRVIADNPAGASPTSCHINGTSTDGAGQVEDYAVIILNRDVVSLTNGAWNVASTWTCNCIPQVDDQVTIKVGHTVNITPAMGLIQCAKIILEAGSSFNVSGTFRVNGNQ